MTSDPIGLNGGLNTYSYVDNNPFTRIDPLGLFVANPGTVGIVEGLINTICGLIVIDKYKSKKLIPTYIDDIAKGKKPRLFEENIQKACEDCNGDPCKGLRERLKKVLDEFHKRRKDMRHDTKKQFLHAYDTPDPNSDTDTTWVGHQQEYIDLKNHLRRLKEALDYYGCDYDTVRVNFYLNSNPPLMPDYM